MIKKIIPIFLILLSVLACKDDVEAPEVVVEIDPEIVEINRIKDSLFAEFTKAKTEVKSRNQIKAALKEQGYKTYDFINEKAQDTILLQQYFMVFFKEGPIRGQNEEETMELQNEHWESLNTMYKAGHVDISGTFLDDSKYVGVTIYNVPTKEEAERLAKEDPMVKAGRLDVEVHPWWAAKGRDLR